MGVCWSIIYKYGQYKSIWPWKRKVKGGTFWKWIRTNYSCRPVACLFSRGQVLPEQLPIRYHTIPCHPHWMVLAQCPGHSWERYWHLFCS